MAAIQLNNVHNPLLTFTKYGKLSFRYVYGLITACFKNYLLLASTRALSHARIMSMDAPMTRYSMPMKLLARAVAKYHAGIK